MYVSINGLANILQLLWYLLRIYSSNYRIIITILVRIKLVCNIVSTNNYFFITVILLKVFFPELLVIANK